MYNNNLPIKGIFSVTTKKEASPSQESQRKVWFFLFCRILKNTERDYQTCKRLINKSNFVYQRAMKGFQDLNSISNADQSSIQH